MLQAVRRFKDIVPLQAEARPALPGEAEPPCAAGPRGMAEELGRLEHRLKLLLERLQSQSPAEPHAGDPVAGELLGRARGYFEEWRQLLLEERSPAEIFKDFALSSYADLLERVYSRLFLMLDGEGRLVRLAHGERWPAGEVPPRPGDLLAPSFPGPERATLGGAWPGLPELLCGALGSGWLLALAEFAPDPLPQRSR